MATPRTLDLVTASEPDETQAEKPPAGDFWAENPPCRYEIHVRDGKTWRYLKPAGQPADPSVIEEILARNLGPGRYRVKVYRNEKVTDEENGKARTLRVAQWNKIVQVKQDLRPAKEEPAPAAAGIDFNALGNFIAQQVDAQLTARLAKQNPAGAPTFAEQMLAGLLPEIVRGRVAGGGTDPKALQAMLDREHARGVEHGRLLERAEYDDRDEVPAVTPGGGQVPPMGAMLGDLAKAGVHRLVDHFVGGAAQAGAPTAAGAQSGLAELEAAIRGAGAGSPEPTEDDLYEGEAEADA